MKFGQNSHNCYGKSGGFTLVELLVVIGITQSTGGGICRNAELRFRRETLPNWGFLGKVSKGAIAILWTGAFHRCIMSAGVSGRRRVRGKDCVPLIDSTISSFDELFSARASGQRALRLT